MAGTRLASKGFVAPPPTLTANLEEALGGVDCAAIVTKHREYFELTPDRMRGVMRTPVVVDGRNVLDLADCAEAGLATRAIGKGIGK